MTMGFGASTDVRIAEFGRELLKDLPAPPYPFKVDAELAKTGARLFQTNCADCHRPHNGRVYQNLGTDLSRSHVVDEKTTVRARIGFTKIGHPDRVVRLPPEGRVTKPFSEFEGVSLKDKLHVVMRSPEETRGYNALPLGGIWAQAPYLHNGSVPTLYHLLMPRERPKRFIKSRLEYDQELVGFAWKAASGPSQSRGYEFDTTAFKTLSNRGHDQDIREQGKTYKLDWTDDPTGAKALVEYMKTL